MIDIDMAFEAICDFVACKVCAEAVKIKETCVRGQNSIYVIECTNCEQKKTFRNCSKLSDKRNELNVRITCAARACGSGPSGLRNFFGVLDLPPPRVTSNYQTVSKVSL